MKEARKAAPVPPAGPGSIRADELMPLAEVSRRLRWGSKSQALAVRSGLRCIPFGRLKYCLGADVLCFFAKLAEGQETGNGKEGRP